MPLYEYRCSKCEVVHEVMQKFSDAPLEKCPQCQGAVSKLMSLSSFALKGSGWYTTDYKKAQSSSNVAPSSSTESSAVAASGNASAAPSQSEVTVGKKECGGTGCSGSSGSACSN